MMRVAVLCNDRLALPALEQLIPSGWLSAVGMPDRSSETQTLIMQRCQRSNISLQLFGKKSFNHQLLQWLKTLEPEVVLVKTFPFRIPESKSWSIL